MILTRGTKCTAMIKSDPFPSLTLFPSLLFSCRLTVVPFAHFDRKNSEAVTLFRDLTFPPFFSSPSVLFLSRSSLLSSLFLFFPICSNNRIIPREVYRVPSDPTLRQFLIAYHAQFFSPLCSSHARVTVQTVSFSDYYHTSLEFGNRVHDLSGRK